MALLASGANVTIDSQGRTASIQGAAPSGVQPGRTRGRRRTAKGAGAGRGPRASAFSQGAAPSGVQPGRSRQQEQEKQVPDSEDEWGEWKPRSEPPRMPKPTHPPPPGLPAGMQAGMY